MESSSAYHQSKIEIEAEMEARLDCLLRHDLCLISAMLPAGCRVLDVGCGKGELLYHLWQEKGIDARGIELSPAGVSHSVGRGLSVVQGNADTDLRDYPDDAFDYVILSQTLQATANPRLILEQLLRIGRAAIVSFPNFGYWRLRGYLAFRGRMPMSRSLSFAWYETPNIHFCTIADFRNLCRDLGVKIDRAFYLDGKNRPCRLAGKLWPNLWAEQALYCIRR